MKSTFWDRIQTIDRRIVYAALLVSILVPLFVNVSLPNYPAKQSVDFYETIQKIGDDPAAANKIVIINGMWSPSTRGENQWQAEAVVTHLMRRHIHFATIAFDIQNNTIMQNAVVQPLAKKYGYVYGRDYVNWGFKPGSVYAVTIKGLVKDIPGTLKTDVNGTPLSQIPVMKTIKTRADVAAVVDITPVASTEAWLGLFQQNNTPPYLLAPTAVGAPTYYPYLDSKQIAGMLTGIKGAGDYESLLGTRSFGTRAAGALSVVYALIILLIVLGNLGYYMARAARRRAQR